MPLLERRILEIHSFPHFPLTRFDILSWNFAYDFVLLYYRSSSSVINFCQFLWELCPFWNVENWQYTVFRILFLHALTYWAEILHLTFTVLEISLSVVNFRQFLYARLQTGRIMVWWCPSVRPSVRVSVRPSVTVFRTFLLHALTYWSEILCITLFLCT